MDVEKKIKLMAWKIGEGGRNVVFTGAGISTESGIPDYRSQGGLWDKYRPVYFDEFCDVLIRGKAGEVLPRIVREVL